MSPSQNPGGPFKGFTPHATPAAAAPRQARPVAAVATAKSGGGSNTLSVVALILAILGLGCPLVGLTGAILGIVAMRTQPNGVALASVIIGSLTTLAVAIATIVMFNSGLRDADSSVPYYAATDPSNPAFVREASMQEAMRFTEVQANDVARLISSYEIEHGSLPDDLETVTAPYGRITDGWGTPYKISVEEAKAAASQSTDAKLIAFIMTAGPDRTWGTADDYVASSSPYVDLVEYGMKTRP
ncbi:MAG: hypothetical protein RLY21_1985 [Planctomycetota bacterium]|jgi:hypothetical protein